MVVLAVVVGLVGAAHAAPPAEPDVEGTLDVTASQWDDVPGPENDRRLQALLQAYESFVDSVAFVEDDAVLTIGSQVVFFQDGRMLSEDRLGDPERFDPIFYRYALGPLTEPPPPTGSPVYSTDLLEALFGRSETEIRDHGRSASFLGHSVFMHEVSLSALGAVDTDIRAAAELDPALITWMREITVAYSFIDREISGSGSRSHHAWGLAVDLVPSSYGGRHVYWRWSRVFNRESWHEIPVSRRWSPPQAVIEAFERHGFIWGGKWSHFDTIHFEYRPEIILYNRMIEAGSAAQ